MIRQVKVYELGKCADCKSIRIAHTPFLPYTFCMDFSYIFRAARPKPETFADFGFQKDDALREDKVFTDAKVPADVLICKRSLPQTDFYVILTLNLAKETLSAQVYDSATDEQYALFDVPSANGAFISQIREQVKNIIEEFRNRCFETADLKEKYFDYMKTHFSAVPDYPWDDSPDAGVFRCKNDKWFALVMKIKYRQIGLIGDEEVFVVNLKAPPDKIPSIVDHKSVFPAWHMNTTHWITVLLTAATNFDHLCELTEQSYTLVCEKVSGKKKSENK